MTEFIDLLGDSEPEAPKPDLRVLRTRSARGKHKRNINPEAVEGKTLADDMPMTSDLLRPVGINLLAEIFGKQPIQIRKRLKHCPTIGTHEVAGKTHPLYDFVVAMSYLVEPKGNIEDWFAQNNAASLPPYVNKMFWDSAHQRNRVLKESGDLWHSDDILALLGRIGMTIKEESFNWLENLPGRDELTDAQYKSLHKSVTQLQVSIQERMLELPSMGETSSMGETIRAELHEAGAIPRGDEE